MHIAIVGSGTAGPAAAIFLARAGHRVTLFERAASLHPVGAGLLIQPTGMAVLARLGLLKDLLELGAPVERLHGVSASGRVVLDLHYRDLRPDLFGLGLHRGALFSALHRAMLSLPIDLRCGVCATGIQSVGNRPMIRDARNALHGPYDLLVIADGARSSLRSAGVTCRARPYQWGAMWFVAEDEGNRFAGVLDQTYRGTREMLGFLPSGRASAGGPPLVSMFWSVRISEIASLHERGVDDWKSRVTALCPRAEPILDQITDTNQLLTAVYHDVVLRQFHSLEHGPVVYLGDAAHAMSPQLGQGANLALVDAMTLAECLADEGSVPTALAEYSRRRRRASRYYQFASRALTPIFQSGITPLARPRDALFGPMCRLGFTRRQMLESLAGVKTGIMPWRRSELPGPG